MKPFEERAKPYKDPRRRAGYEAERQMAHYLDNMLGPRSECLVLHGLRLEDRTRTDVNGGPVVAQIDHLVLHKRGAFIVESKSCTGVVKISVSSSGRDEWSIKSKGQPAFVGMRSALQQGERQATILRDLLDRQASQLLGKQLFGLMQRGFKHFPIQVIAAISDRGRIERPRKWTPNSEPFRCAIEKADNVAGFIADELSAHKRNSSVLLGNPKSQYGMWDCKDDELHGVAQALLEMHSPAQREKAETRPHGAHDDRACKSCGETKNLDPRPGRYGPYWKCGACDANTTMPSVCSACGANDMDAVRVRQREGSFVRCCAGCGVDEVVARASGG